MVEPDTTPPALPAASPTSPTRRRLDWWKLISGLLVIGAIGGIIAVFAGYKGEQESVLPRVIEALSPTPGSPVVPSQSTVSADLVDGWNAALKIDGVELPPDQLTTIAAQQLFSFTPGPEKEIRRFKGGEHIATVVFWPITGTEERDAQEYSWRFTVN